MSAVNCFEHMGLWRYGWAICLHACPYPWHGPDLRGGCCIAMSTWRCSVAVASGAGRVIINAMRLYPEADLLYF